MDHMLTRQEMLIGEEKTKKIKDSNIIVFGVGGVGGFAIEALVRAGVGNITIVDSDTVNVTNLNRQIIALNSTIGKYKVDVMEERIKDINPLCNVTKYNIFYEPGCDAIDLTKYDYIVDCIDSLKSKIDIIKNAYDNNIKIISCMGMGNKLKPLMIEIADINKTSYCPLARKIRIELKKLGVKKLKVCYSKEEPIKSGERFPASISFVPSTAGLIIAGEVINDIINE